MQAAIFDQFTLRRPTSRQPEAACALANLRLFGGDSVRNLLEQNRPLTFYLFRRGSCCLCDASGGRFAHARESILMGTFDMQFIRPFFLPLVLAVGFTACGLVVSHPAHAQVDVAVSVDVEPPPLPVY